MREIIFDVETTGLDPLTDRIVEIGCVELVNKYPTGNTFHTYCNPGRTMPADAFAIHGLSTGFLSNKPRFADIAPDLMAFIGGDTMLVAHNAGFDVAFLNQELAYADRPERISYERVIDTLMIARRLHAGSGNSLDDLCVRYRIDTSARTKHTALLDAELLAKVYLELIDARQGMLDLTTRQAATARTAAIMLRSVSLPSRLTDADIEAHRALIGTIKNAIWNEYFEPEPLQEAA